MSVGQGQPPALLRPIPIHLPRHPEIDTLRFRLPQSIEKPAKSIPSLWNPAVDLCSPRRECDSKKTSYLPLKQSLITIPPSPASLPTASIPFTSAASMPASAILKSFKRAQTIPPASIKSTTGTYSSIYQQLERYFPRSQENPLTVLTSKAGLFPVLLGFPGSMLGYPTQSTPTPHSNQSITQGHTTLQNSPNLEQTGTVIERMDSSQPQSSRALLGQQHQQFPHHNQHNQQQHSRTQHHHPISHFQPSMPPSDGQITFPSPLAVAQSQTVMCRINASQMLSPAISFEDAVGHNYGRKLFPCPQCRYTTDRRNNLKRHMLTMHQTSPKMQECCGILFNTKASLREHAMIFHYQGYTCYFCGRRFCRKALLKRHLSVHNGQKDFICNICDYATSHKSNLERHRKVHSRQDGGKEEGEGRHSYHDDGKSNASEAVSHDDVSSDELSVCSDFDDDTDEEINVHSD